MKPSNCPHDPSQTQGAIGMYHCPECGEMQLAGLPHTGILEESDMDALNSQRGLQEFIDEHLAAIAITLPIVVKQPASFACGYESGYKQALLDIEREFCEEPESLF